MTDESDVEKAKSLISTGAEIAGAAVGGAIGFFAAGPAGAAGAGTLGVILAKAGTKVLGDVAERVLSDREKVRMGATAAIAFNKIEERVSKGQKPRDDGFFEADDARPASEELLEGTLKKARDEYEEKKVYMLGNFYSNLVFSPGVSVQEANYYLRLFETLTYRQLCVICLVFMLPNYPKFQVLRKIDYRSNNKDMSATTVTLLQEIFGLYNQGLISCRTIDGTGNTALLGWHDVIPANMQLTGLGERFKDLFLGGGNFDTSDIINIVSLLR